MVSEGGFVKEPSTLLRISLGGSDGSQDKLKDVLFRN
jgi:hypothetical protein